MARFFVAVAMMLVSVGSTCSYVDRAGEFSVATEKSILSVPGFPPVPEVAPTEAQPVDRRVWPVAYQQPPATPKKKAAMSKKAALAKKKAAMSKKSVAASGKAAMSKKAAVAGKAAVPAGAKALDLPDPPPASPDPLVSPGEALKAWDTAQMKKVWDLTNLSPQDEIRLGEELNALVLASTPALESGPTPRRLVDAADPIVDRRTRREINYRFVVLDSEAINAFSHPGGYVYVTKGLMDWVGEEQDFVLEFIVAHEIAHVDQRHAIICLNDPKVKQLGLGTLQQFFLLIFPWGYVDPLDYDADRWAFTQMQRLDRTKRESLAFLRKLERYAEENGFVNGRAKANRPDLDAAPFENHLRAHPAAYARLKLLLALSTAESTAKPSAPGGAR